VIEVLTAAQLGRTADLMRHAPHAAVFVWPFVESIGYAKDLSCHLGRHDLEIRPMSDLEYLRGRKLPGLVIDHACYRHATTRQLDLIQRLESYANVA
jgi:hypothetical protein